MILKRLKLITKLYIRQTENKSQATNIDILPLKAKVDIIVVFMHWGRELLLGPLPYQLHITEHLMSLGVHAIIGSHPHVLQPHWITKDNKLVAYSLGNFLFPPIRPVGGNTPVMNLGLVK